MIELKNVKKTYKTKYQKNFFVSEKVEVQAVKGIDMTIEKGKITGLLGINGAGKTTTVKMIATLLSPTEGEIIVDGFSVKKDEMIVKSKLNMIAGGERMIYWRLTARENLNYFGSLYGLSGLKLKSRVDEMLKKVGLWEKADIPVEKYSKGMKQRLQIARGMLNDPDYILLDEPTLGLDVQIAKEMRAFFKELKEDGKGILLTTHYMQEVEELCDFIYILHDGEIIQKGTPMEIVALHGAYEDDSLEDAILNMSKHLKDVV